MEEPIIERYEFDTVEESITFLSEYQGKNPGKKITKYELELLVDIAHVLLLITVIATGIH
jgi:hypothetical protein